MSVLQQVGQCLPKTSYMCFYQNMSLLCVQIINFNHDKKKTKQHVKIC
jgi:hypothetical protein